MPIEELYTNAFDGTYVEWVEVGSPPYLHDSDIDYIYTSANGAREGDWSFPASSGSGTINSVKLRFEERQTASDAGLVEVYVWDGTTWHYVGYFGTYSTFLVWSEIDVTNVLNTWDKINACKVRLIFYVIAGGIQVVRRLTRKVDYTPIVDPLVRKSIFKMDLGPRPRSRLLFNPTLILKGVVPPQPPAPTWEDFMEEWF